jgi:hypothetical protein
VGKHSRQGIQIVGAIWKIASSSIKKGAYRAISQRNREEAGLKSVFWNSLALLDL